MRCWLWMMALLAALLLAAITLLLVFGALRDPTRSAHGMLGSALWTTFGPHLALVSWLAAGLALLGFRQGFRRLALPALVLSFVAGLGSTAITLRIVSAAAAAGGSVNPMTGLWLRSMSSGGPDAVEVFVTRGDLPLRMAIYRPPPSAQPAPVLLYIHGGGFMTGSFVETDADLRWFAQRGWLVFSAEYRLFTQQVPSWDLAPRDVACAAAWVNAHAAHYGGDGQRLAILGDSAGGNLAINLAYAAAQGQLRADCGGVVPRPQAVVVQYPALDPMAIYEHGFPVPGFEPTMLVRGYIGGDPADFPERIAAVRSSTFISATAPPTLIIEPEKDGLVPAWSVYDFVGQARAAGVEVELVRIPFANHVYNQLAAGSLGNQARLTITQRFLNEQGLAPLPGR
ncbi:MAG: alpha/beta hydrolase [Planctomycetota bacterium]|nr:MAG: alpha/beta hydrolase [Planctomycetota bacterium]